MKSKVYTLVRPYKIEETYKNIDLKDGWVLVEPTYGTFCPADMRYFTGSRSPEKLAQKLPMALIHEGIGVVIDGNGTNLTDGQRVIIVPNIPGRLFEEEEIGDTDKYSKNVRFMGSGYDGIAQSKLVHPAENLIPIPDNVSDGIAALAENASISISAVNETIEKFESYGDNIRVAVFGDGPVGYFAAAYLRYNFNLSKTQFTVFGANDEKLSKFYFANTENVNKVGFSQYAYSFDYIVEATGGNYSASSINQAIDIFDYLGTLVLLGVSEDKVPVNTRDVLEKGLTIHGSSRSSSKDFVKWLELVDTNDDYVAALEQIKSDDITEVSNAEDFSNFFEYWSKTPYWQKSLIKFNWKE